MEYEDASRRAGIQLRGLRQERRISQRQLADDVGVDSSLVTRVERGQDARLSTWTKLFEGLGYRLNLEVEELCEEAADLLSEEAERREKRRLEGLCSGKRRFWR
jgi:transcriptional regulator with XRE-family HTH domain